MKKADHAEDVEKRLAAFALTARVIAKPAGPSHLRSVTYRRIVRLSGIYDATLMLLFLFPGAVAITMNAIRTIHLALSLPGAMQTLSAFGYFFINMMAAITTVWAVARIIEPAPTYGYTIACFACYWPRS